MNAPSTPTPSGPVLSSDRLLSLDLIRGVAVLMIFVVNIKAMGAPASYYGVAELWSSGLDQNLARLQRLLVDEKFVTLFTALFGVGLAIFCDRARAKGAGRFLIARRLTILLAIGLAHGFLIWFGDILTLYACAGAVAVLFVRHSPTALYTAAGVLIVAQTGFTSALDAGALPRGIQALFTTPFDISPAALDAERTAFLGGVADQFAERSRMFVAQFTSDVGHIGLRTIAIMLAGMALHRQGFFALAWSMKRYATVCAAALIGGGVLRVTLGLIAEDALPPLLAGLFNLGANAAMAFGYATVIVIAVKAGVRFAPLSSVGRMALTNYIASSLIATTLFYGHAGGLFGAISLVQMMGVVAASWIAMLIWSPLWLARFRFGPLEWAWRSLTYGTSQPLRRADGALG